MTLTDFRDLDTHLNNGFRPSSARTVARSFTCLRLQLF